MIWITSVANLNEKGKWVLKNRVAPILQRKTKLRANVKKHIKFETVNYRGKSITVPLSYFPDERGDRYMVRLVKGFIRNFHPEYDYSADKFHTQVAKPHNPPEWHLWETLIVGLKQTHFSRGDGVIDVWHCLPHGDDIGAWLFCFYNAAFVVVFHGKGEHF
jgi:hypothetical protein